MVPFEDLDLLWDQNRSGNVFFDFYLELKNENLLEEGVHNFLDFLKGFDIEDRSLAWERFKKSAVPGITRIMETMQISVIELPRYELSDARSIIERNSKGRKDRSIINDAIMLEFLSDGEEHTNEPFLSTWDKTLINSRVEFIRERRIRNYWYAYYPSKLLNHLSLLDFNVNAEAMTMEFMSIVEAMNFSEKTKGFLYELIDLLDITPNDKKRKIAQKLVEFKKRNLIDLDNKEESNRSSDKMSEAILKVLKRITYTYNNPEKNATKHGIDTLKKAISVSDKSTDFGKIVEEESQYYYENGENSSKLLKKINDFIEHSLKTQNGIKK